MVYGKEMEMETYHQFATIFCQSVGKIRSKFYSYSKLHPTNIWENEVNQVGPNLHFIESSEQVSECLALFLTDINLLLGNYSG